MIKELFPKLIIEDEEIEEFKKYLLIKGQFLYKQIYELILLTDEEVHYREIAQIIRYDKYLRNTLYKFLSALEEQWRATIFSKLEYNSTKKELINNNIDLKKIVKKVNLNDSVFYWASFNKKFTLSKIIEIIQQKSKDLDIELDNEHAAMLKKLRNSVMHHNLLLFSINESIEEVLNEIKTIEKSIEVLWQLLDYNLSNTLEKEINLGNYRGGRIDSEAPNLTRFCLRRFKNGIFI
ncbi:MAG: hypothetical protein AB7E61_06730 [Acholeplasmataceae bacterium]